MDDDKTGRLSKQVGLLSLFKSEVLGKGCNGTVFRGHFLSTIDVAIKRVDKSFIRVESNLLLKAALHPNIIRYYATEDDHIEFLYVAIELCACTLEELVFGKYSGPPVCDSQGILYQISLGLDHLHFLEIIHGNLKPSNILISIPASSNVKPQVKLADFGFHRQSQRSHQQADDNQWIWPACSEAWMAPDHIITFASDIYPLGRIFGFVLTNGVVSNGCEGEHRSYRWIKKVLTPLSLDHLKNVRNAPHILQLVSSMLEEAPEQRPTASEILRHSFFSPSKRRIEDVARGEHILDIDNVEEIGSAHLVRKDTQVRGVTLKAICYSATMQSAQVSYPCLSTNEAPSTKKARTGTVNTSLQPSNVQPMKEVELTNHETCFRLLDLACNEAIHLVNEESDNQQIEREAVSVIETVASLTSLPPSPPPSSISQQQLPSSSAPSPTHPPSRPSEGEGQYIKEVHTSLPPPSDDLLVNKQANHAGTNNALSHSPDLDSNPTNLLLQPLDVNVLGLSGPLAASSPIQVPKFPNFDNKALFGEEKDGFINALVHAKLCKSTNCFKDPTCKIMKSVMAHIFICKGFTNSSCPSCKQVCNSVRAHAKDCRKFNCFVPNCSEIRRKLLQTGSKTRVLFPHRVPNLESGSRRLTALITAAEVTQSETQKQPTVNAADASETVSSLLPSLEVVSSSSNGLEEQTSGPSGAIQSSTAAIADSEASLTDQDDSVIKLDDKDDGDSDFEEGSGPSNRSERANISRKEDIVKQEEFIHLCRQQCLSSAEMSRLLDLASDRNVELNSKYRSTTNTPILILCRYNHSDSLFPILKQLLNFEDVDPNACNKFGHNALTYVLRYFSSKNTVDCVRLLLKRGVNVNVQVKEKHYQWTAIEYLCQFYNGSNLIDIARFLLHYGANLDSAAKAVKLLKNRNLRRDADILTKIIRSFREGQGRVLNKKELELMDICHQTQLLTDDQLERFHELVLDKELDLNCKNASGQTPLILLARNNQSDKLRFYIEAFLQRNCVDLDYQDEVGGWNVLLAVCYFYRNQHLPEVISLLLQHDLNLDAVNKKGWSAIFSLCLYSRSYLSDFPGVLQLLLDKDVDVKATNFKGWNTLVALTYHNHQHSAFLDMARLLVDRGADPNATDYKLRNPFLIVCEEHRGNDLVDILRALVALGVNPLAKDVENRGAIEIIEKCQPEILNDENFRSLFSV